LALGNATNNVGQVNGASHITITSAIENAAGVAARLTKTGTGTLTLSHANTYNGGTTIRQGAVVVSNATGSATGVGKVQVNLGLLQGVGKIEGAVTVGNGSSSGATILGGNSTSLGILTINSTLTSRSFSSYM